MPSSVDPSQIQTGPGKVHVDVVSAAAELFSSGASAIIGAVSAVISQPLAAPAESAVSFAASGSIVLSAADGPFYVGDDVSTPIDQLFKLVKANGNDVVIDAGYVTVQSISPASIGDGFFAGNLTVNFSNAIPAQTAADGYKVIYGKRVTVASLPPELASFPSIQRSDEHPKFPYYFRPNNERAPTSLTNSIDTTVANSYPDPFLAHWKAEINEGFQPSFSPFDQTIRGGAIGFVNINGKLNVSDTAEFHYQGHQAAAFYTGYFKGDNNTTLAARRLYTYIDPNTLATVNPTGTDPDMIELGVLQYFYTTFFSPNLKTAIRVGVDMVKVRYQAGAFDGQEEVFVIGALDAGNPRRATLLTLGGAPANLGGTQVASVVWIRSGFFFGGDNEAGTTTSLLKGMGHFVPGSITDDPLVEHAQEPPFFSSGTVHINRADTSRAFWNLSAFRWGGHVEVDTVVGNLGSRRVNGELWGDGSIQSYAGHIAGLHQKRSDNGFLVTTDTSLSWNPFSASKTHIQVDGSAAVAKTITLTLDAAYLADSQNGDEITIIVFHVAGGISRTQSKIIWPVQFYFSGNDDDIRIGSTPDYQFPHMKFTGIRHNGKFLMTRTDYPEIDSL